MDKTSTGSSTSVHEWPWMNTSLSPDERATLLLAQMTLEEKIDMAHGEHSPDGYYNALIARLGIPALTMTDGPAGIQRNEHADLPSLTLSNEQDLLVQTVVAANPRTIVVVASGGPVLMPWLEQVPAVLESWYGGQEMGNALADVLFGDVTPSGKLPVTFPRSDTDTPLSEPSQYSRTERIAHLIEGLFVGCRGYDQFGIEPLFPFGYGLSYTSFAYSQLQVEPETTDGTRAIRVSFTITNTGAYAGAEVAQVYLGLPASTGEPPRRLVSWAKVELEPDETREVSVTLDPNTTSHPLSYWDAKTNGWQVASGDYRVDVGASSRDIRLTGTMHVHQTEKYDDLAHTWVAEAGEFEVLVGASSQDIRGTATFTLTTSSHWPS